MISLIILVRDSCVSYREVNRRARVETRIVSALGPSTLLCVSNRMVIGLETNERGAQDHPAGFGRSPIKLVSLSKAWQHFIKLSVEASMWAMTCLCEK